MGLRKGGAALPVIASRKASVLFSTSAMSRSIRLRRTSRPGGPSATNEHRCPFSTSSSSKRGSSAETSAGALVTSDSAPTGESIPSGNRDLPTCPAALSGAIRTVTKSLVRAKNLSYCNIYSTEVQRLDNLHDEAGG